MIVLLLALVGCGSTEDPELLAYRAAIAKYEEGVSALNEGDGDKAAIAFADAQEMRPDDVLLRAWRAKALAQDGRLDEAIAELDQVLSVRPSFLEARFNRAAYSARKQDFEAAAHDVRMLLAGDRIRPEQIYEDSDFDVARTHGAFSFLPAPDVSVELSTPNHRVVLGTEVQLGLQVSSSIDLGSYSISGVVEGPVQLLKVTEEVGDKAVVVRWTVRAVGEGVTRVGPFNVSTAYAASVNAEGQTFDVWSPKGRLQGASVNIPLYLPSTVRGEHQIPGAWREGNMVFVLTDEGAKVRVTPEQASDPVVYTQSTNGVANFVVRAYPGDGPLRVQISVRGQMMLDSTY